MTAKTKVLVIDDEPIVARSIGRSLHSYDVMVCVDAAEALELMRLGDYDVVICDVLMPRLDGTELYRSIVRERDHYVGRFVFMSGGGHAGPALEFIRERELPLLAKPFTAKELAAVCAYFLPH